MTSRRPCTAIQGHAGVSLTVETQMGPCQVVPSPVIQVPGHLQPSLCQHKDQCDQPHPPGDDRRAEVGRAALSYEGHPGQCPGDHPKCLLSTAPGAFSAPPTPASNPHEAMKGLLLLPHYTDGETEAPRVVTYLGGDSVRFQSEHMATKTHGHSPTWLSSHPAPGTPFMWAEAGSTGGWCRYQCGCPSPHPRKSLHF